MLTTQSIAASLNPKELHLMQDINSAGIQEKFLKNQLTPYEKLTFLDIQRFIDQDQCQPKKIHAFAAYPNMAEINAIDTPAALMIDIGNNTWITVMVSQEGDLKHYKINAGYKLTLAQESDIRVKLKQAAGEQAVIKITENKTSADILDGYKVLQVAYNSLYPEHEFSKQPVDKLQAYIYQKQLEAIELTPEQDKVLATAIRNKFDNSGKIKTIATADIGYLLKKPVAVVKVADQRAAAVQTALAKVKLSDQTISFPGASQAANLNSMDYQSWFIALHDRFKKSGTKIIPDQLVINCCNLAAIEGLLAYNATQLSLPCRRLVLQLDKGAGDTDNFMLYFKAMLLTIADSNTAALEIKGAEGLSEANIQELVDFVVNRKIAINITLPEPYQHTIHQKNIDDAVSDNIRNKHINNMQMPKEQPIMSNAVDANTPIVSNSSSARKRHSSNSKNISVEMAAQEEKQKEADVHIAAEMHIATATSNTDADELITTPAYELYQFDQALKDGGMDDNKAYLVCSTPTTLEGTTAYGYLQPFIDPQAEKKRIEEYKQANAELQEQYKKCMKDGSDDWQKNHKKRDLDNKYVEIMNQFMYISAGANIFYNWLGSVSYINELEQHIQISTAACAELLRYNNKFKHGLDLENLPAGFSLKTIYTKPDDKSFTSYVIHFDAELKRAALYDPLKEQTPEPYKIKILTQSLFDKWLNSAIDTDPIKSAWNKLNKLDYDHNEHQLFKQFLPDMLLLQDEKLNSLFELVFDNDGKFSIEKFKFLMEDRAQLFNILHGNAADQAFVATEKIIAKLFNDKKEAVKLFLCAETKDNSLENHLLGKITSDNSTLQEQLKDLSSTFSYDQLLQLYIELGDKGITALQGLIANNKVFFEDHSAAIKQEKNCAIFLSPDYLKTIDVIKNFTPNEKIWWDELLKQHCAAQQETNLIDLVNAFQKFKQEIGNLSNGKLNLGPECKITGANSLPVALSRALTILKKSSSENLEAQWAEIPYLDLSSRGAIQALAIKDIDYTQHRHINFITREMGLKSNGIELHKVYYNVALMECIPVSKVTLSPDGSTEAKKFAVFKCSGSNAIEQDRIFFINASFQNTGKCQMPLQFYKDIHKDLLSMANFKSLDSRAWFMNLLLSATTGADNVEINGTLEQAKDDVKKLFELIINTPGLMDFFNNTMDQGKGYALKDLIQLAHLFSFAVAQKRQTIVDAIILKPDIFLAGIKNYPLDGMTAEQRNNVIGNYVNVAYEITDRLKGEDMESANRLLALIDVFHFQISDCSEDKLDQFKPYVGIWLDAKVADGAKHFPSYYVWDLLLNMVVGDNKLTPADLLEIFQQLMNSQDKRLLGNTKHDGVDAIQFQIAIADVMAGMTLKSGAKITTYFPKGFLENYCRTPDLSNVVSDKINKYFGSSAQANQIRKMLLTNFKNHSNYYNIALVKEIYFIYNNIGTANKPTDVLNKEKNNFITAITSSPGLYLNEDNTSALGYFISLLENVEKNAASAEFMDFLKFEQSFSRNNSSITPTLSLASKARYYLEIIQSKEWKEGVRELSSLSAVDLQPRLAEFLLAMNNINEEKVFDLRKKALDVFKGLNDAIFKNPGSKKQILELYDSCVRNVSVQQAEEKFVPLYKEEDDATKENTKQSFNSFSRDLKKLQNNPNKKFLENLVIFLVKLPSAPQVTTIKNMLKICADNNYGEMFIAELREICANTPVPDIKEILKWHSESIPLIKQNISAQENLNRYQGNMRKFHVTALRNNRLRDLVIAINNSFDILKQQYPEDCQDILLSLYIQFNEKNNKKERTPHSLVLLINQINTMFAQSSDKAFFLKLAELLITGNKGYTLDKFTNLLEIAKNDSRFLEALKETYKTAPYPTIDQICEWHEQARTSESKAYAEVIATNQTKLSLKPYARTEGNIFNPEKAQEQLNAFQVDGQPGFKDIDVSKYAEIIGGMRGKSIQDLLAIFNGFKDKRQQVEIDYETLVAAAAELLYRSQGLELNTTQYLAVLAAFKTKGHVTSQIATSEGKTRIMAVENACQCILGYTVDFVTSDVQLASRDYIGAKAYFNMLGLKTSLIHANSDPAVYKIGGINYSDPANLSLFRNKANVQGRGKETIDPDPTKRALNADEVDVLQFNLGKMKFNFSQEADESICGMPWVYTMLMEYYKDSEKTILYNNDIDSGREDFLKFAEQYCAEKGHDITRLRNLTPAQIEQWQESAIDANSLEFAKDFSITPDLFTETGDGEKYSSIINVLFGNRIAKGSKYSQGVHQCLCAKLNLLKANLDAVQDENLREILRKCVDDFIIEDEKQIIYSSTSKSLLDDYKQGALKAVTGTAGSDTERQEAAALYGLCDNNMHFVDIPVHNTSKRIDNVVSYDNADQQFEQLIAGIKVALEMHQPILIIAENDAESQTLYQKVTQRLVKDGVIKEHKPGEKDNKIERIHSDLSSEEENTLLAKAGRAGQITISTSMTGRGTDILLSKEDRAKEKGLHVMLTYLPTYRDYRQIIGRAGRFGDQGSSLLLLDKERTKKALGLKQGIDDNKLNEFIKKAQDMMDMDNQCERLVETTASDFRMKLTHGFFAMLYQVPNTDKDANKHLSLIWTTFMQRTDRAWREISGEIQAKLAEETIDTEAIDVLLTEYQEKVDKSWRYLCDGVLELGIKSIDIKKLQECLPQKLLLSDKSKELLDKASQQRASLVSQESSVENKSNEKLEPVIETEQKSVKAEPSAENKSNEKQELAIEQKHELSAEDKSDEKQEPVIETEQKSVKAEPSAENKSNEKQEPVIETEQKSVKQKQEPTDQQLIDAMKSQDNNTQNIFSIVQKLQNIIGSISNNNGAQDINDLRIELNKLKKGKEISVAKETSIQTIQRACKAINTFITKNSELQFEYKGKNNKLGGKQELQKDLKKIINSGWMVSKKLNL